MISAYHIIFGAYGFWLPNDPRGSWSTFIGSYELLRFGPTTKTTDRRSLANQEHDPSIRMAAKKALKFTPIEFTGIQARAVARGISIYCDKAGLAVWACAVLPDHVHLVLPRSNRSVDQVVVQIKGCATRQLKEEGIHPLAHLVTEDNDRSPKCFARGCWTVFLDPEDIPRAIQYVEENPLKEGKKRQNWSFVTPYPGWHPGSPRRA